MCEAYSGERSKDHPGYLVPDPERVKEMAERVAALPDGLRVGICWRSQYSHRDRDIHYTKLEMWESILRIPGITFVNVQYDQREDELQAVEQEFGVRIHRWDDVDLRKDLEGAFALTKNLDMVISTSTSPGRIGECLEEGVHPTLRSASSNLFSTVCPCGWRCEPWSNDPSYAMRSAIMQ